MHNCAWETVGKSLGSTLVLAYQLIVYIVSLLGGGSWTISQPASVYMYIHVCIIITYIHVYMYMYQYIYIIVRPSSSIVRNCAL